MIDFDISVNSAGLQSFRSRLDREMRKAVEDAAEKVKPVVRAQILALDAYDTFALFESVYTKTHTRSGYAYARAEGAYAYATNPTKWEEIWRSKGGQTAFHPEAPDMGPYESLVTTAAAHDRKVEEGYISIYKNWVEPRPFMETSARIAWPAVVKEFEKALRRSR